MHNVVDAAAAGDCAALSVLLSQGVDPNSTDADGCSALAQAAAGGHVVAVRQLLVAGARPKGGAHSPLAVAVQGAHDVVVEVLLEAGADPNTPSSGLRTPLMDAASSTASDRAALLRAACLLLARGADVDAHDCDGDTALSLTLERKELALAALLVAHRASPHTPCKALSPAATEAAKAVGALVALPGSDERSPALRAWTPLADFRAMRVYCSTAHGSLPVDLLLPGTPSRPTSAKAAAPPASAPPSARAMPAAFGGLLIDDHARAVDMPAESRADHVRRLPLVRIDLDVGREFAEFAALDRWRVRVGERMSAEPVRVPSIRLQVRHPAVCPPELTAEPSNDPGAGLIAGAVLSVLRQLAHPLERFTPPSAEGVAFGAVGGDRDGAQLVKDVLAALEIALR